MNEDMIYQLLRLWGRMEGNRQLLFDRLYSNYLRKQETTEIIKLLNGWAKEWETEQNETLEDFFYKKVAELYAEY